MEKISAKELLINIEEDSFWGGYEINGVFLLDDMSLSNFISGTILMFNCKFIDQVILTNFTSHEIEIKFRKVEFHSDFKSSDFHTYKIEFEECTFNKNFELVNSSFKDAIFSNCLFKSNAIITTNEFEKLSYLRNQAHNIVYFFGNRIPMSFTIVTTENNGNIIVNGDYPFGENAFINELIFTQNINNKNEFTATKLKINHAQIKGKNFEGLIRFGDIKINKFHFIDFENFGSLMISRIEVIDNLSNIVVRNSNMGKFFLHNIDFSKFKQLFIWDSNISELTYTNVVWCKKLTKTELENKSNQREIYRQLKIAAKNNNNKFDELAFFGNEMNEHSKLKIGFYDKFIINTNRWSNNHGQSWAKAFCWIIIINTFLYVLIKIILGVENFNDSTFTREMAEFIMFINPVHTFSEVFIPETNENINIALVIDGLSRLINSYLIFQFISAFRKFVKN